MRIRRKINPICYIYDSYQIGFNLITNRLLTGNYKILFQSLTGTIDRKRIFHDPLYTLALGTDASFYRMIPKMVIRANDEEEVSCILKECSKYSVPVTFRAAGTSLSGQAVTESVLVITGDNWKKFRINKDGSEIRLQPGLTGGHVNKLLAPYGRKIGPDPASINAAMIGGITVNNASGMCCGTSRNSYKTIAGMRIILAVGTILDTTDDISKRAFRNTHTKLLSDISDLAERAKGNARLAEKIRKKYSIKNTTGYSLNALIDFSDPFDIIEHLMIGSEGTLGFIAEVILKTVIEHPCRGSSLMIFPDIGQACKAVSLLKTEPVSAVELIDRAGLRSVENENGMPPFLKDLKHTACALLVETVAPTDDKLSANIRKIRIAAGTIPTETAIQFTTVPDEYELLWKIRKGLFPSVGAMRKTGTTVIIEDVAFPLDLLAEATTDLQKLLKKYGYDEAVIFGHALDGNLHFVFTQDFSTTEEIERYGNLMNDLSEMVVKKYDGSLKAEHGTGRNMAPFVEMEWGKEAYDNMKEIKSIFDPKNIPNPGVILNNVKDVHLMNLKPIPASSGITDKCTECGFCEPSCVSADLTLTPRQRIAVHREMTSLAKSGHQPHVAAALAREFSYSGDCTCATDGLCATNCPVKNDTGKLIKEIRSGKIAGREKKAFWLADHMWVVTSAARKGLSSVSFFHKVRGTALMKAFSSGLRKLSLEKIPSWNTYMPSGARKIRIEKPPQQDKELRVVYFESIHIKIRIS